MSKARLVITAVVVVEGRSQGEAARAYGVSQGWASKLVARYRAEGQVAFEPRPRRPKTSPAAISDEVAELIVALRKELAGQGLDAGPDTICWHLAHHHKVTVPAATVSRYLARAGLVSPQPAKRPRSSYVRFEAAQPNECWQADFTHYPLAGGTGSEVLTWLDDHSRLALSVTAHRRVTGPVVLAAFRAAVAAYGAPASTLTDNGMVFTARFAGGRGGRNGLETGLRRLGIIQKNGKPDHPQTQGKVERFQQTMKKMAGRPAAPARHRRPAAGPARYLRPVQPPAAAPVPGPPGHPRGRLRRPAQSGRRRPARRCPLPGPQRRHRRKRHRHLADRRKLHHIGIGRIHAGTAVLILVQDLHIRIINAATGEQLRELILDPTRNDQPTGAPKGPTRRHPTTQDPEP
ncbi:MAG TPA: DDE-type integrase/transposase/recombinase [Trebonia sp.]|jgi:transposase InsO family protein|nr:DDE-type integrase/transposase/recombinase [Trebonia sp.]